MLKSLGLIETIGLTAGITAADAAVKSANVTLVGYELAKGSGRTVIKVEGDVGAVKAAVEAACAAALQVGKIAGTKVIARPSASLESLIRNRDTVGYTAECVTKQDTQKDPCFESEVKAEDILKPVEPEKAEETGETPSVQGASETDIDVESAKPDNQRVQEKKSDENPQEVQKKNVKKNSKTKK
ncbi:BMC domain-containing protein [Aminipila terrae]|uniref:BMC domain-containing protein n=2 Tax=Aminipila terrae TaxID=2697030 RepID=A0A6P1MQD4_9FIRM|nr:BMC domain-containing protein [Aminipila terrae]